MKALFGVSSKKRASFVFLQALVATFAVIFRDFV